MHLVNAHGKLIIKSRQNHEEKYTKCVHFVFVSVVHFHLQKSKLVGGHLIIIWRQNRFETISFPRPPLLPFFLQFLFLLPINRLKIKYRNLKKKKKKKKRERKGGERRDWLFGNQFGVHIIIISIISDRRLIGLPNENGPHLWHKMHTSSMRDFSVILACN